MELQLRERLKTTHESCQIDKWSKIQALYEQQFKITLKEVLYTKMK